MKYFVSLLMTAALVWLLIPIPLNADDQGLYNTASGLIWCRNERACIHEVAHALDQCAGWVSHSPEFGNALLVYMLTEEQVSLRIAIASTPGFTRWAGYMRDTQSEVYATIFRVADGRRENMPEAFRKFYDWERAGMMISRINLQGDEHGKYISGKCR